MQLKQNIFTDNLMFEYNNKYEFLQMYDFIRTYAVAFIMRESFFFVIHRVLTSKQCPDKTASSSMKRLPSKLCIGKLRRN